MPRDLFGDVVHPSIRIGSRKWYTLPLSIIVHSLVIAVVVIAPLMAADVLPAPPSMIAFITGAPPPAPPAPPVRSVAPRAVFDVNPAAAPTEAPAAITPETGFEPEAAAGTGVEGGLPDGIQGSITHGLSEPPPPPPAPTAPIRVSVGVRQPAKIRDVQPAYPAIAQSARVQGMVVLEAVLAADGRVTEVRILRSIPLLDQAALDAVRQWVYTPTLLNGVPVPVVMTVTVTFTLR
jgi:protein TonB